MGRGLWCCPGLNGHLHANIRPSHLNRLDAASRLLWLSCACGKFLHEVSFLFSLTSAIPAVPTVLILNIWHLHLELALNDGLQALS